MGSGNHALRGGPDLPWEGAILMGRDIPLQSIGTLRSSVQEQLNPLRCRLGCGLRWVQGIVLDGGPEVLRDIAMATNFGMQFV